MNLEPVPATAASAHTGAGARFGPLVPYLLLTAALLLLFRDTAVAMVTIWIRSETFTHAFLVPPIVVWLVWRQRERLALLEPRPAAWMLLPMAAMCGLWVLGDLASVNAATQFALVALLVLSVPAVFGLEVARALTFPLLFAFFAWPVGEFLVPLMMEWTADFTVAALAASGIPVFRDGLQFVIPSGNWSVVEACSGVRYLIASFMVGTLFAYLNYSSTRRRVIFMLVSLAVPVVANWLRAYIIVMLGHLSGNKIAAGVDHLIYGWVFFGVVIGIMFVIGARWTEPEPPLPAAPPAPSAAARTANRNATWRVGVAALALLLAAHGLVWKLSQPSGVPVAPLALADTVAGGWQAEPAPATRWVPHYPLGVASARSYARGADRVTLQVAYYRDQGYERKLVTSSNGLVEGGEGSAWAVVAAGGTRVELPQGAVPLRTAVLRASPNAAVFDAERQRVWQVLWVADRLIVRDAEAKLRLAFDRLLGRGDDGAAIFISTALPEDTPEAVAAADRRLAEFTREQLPALVQQLRAVREQRR